MLAGVHKLESVGGCKDEGGREGGLGTMEGPVGLRVVGDVVGAQEGEVDEGRDVGCREGSFVGRAK